MIVWFIPTGSWNADVVYVAVMTPTTVVSVPVPSVTPPSRNVTVPVGSSGPAVST